MQKWTTEGLPTRFLSKKGGGGGWKFQGHVEKFWQNWKNFRNEPNSRNSMLFSDKILQQIVATTERQPTSFVMAGYWKFWEFRYLHYLVIFDPKWLFIGQNLEYEFHIKPKNIEIIW